MSNFISLSFAQPSKATTQKTQTDQVAEHGGNSTNVGVASGTRAKAFRSSSRPAQALVVARADFTVVQNGRSKTSNPKGLTASKTQGSSSDFFATTCPTFPRSFGMPISPRPAHVPFQGPVTVIAGGHEDGFPNFLGRFSSQSRY